jgi:hypothetical protein
MSTADPRGHAPGSGRRTLTVLPRAARIILCVLCAFLAVVAALLLALTAAYLGREGHSANIALVISLVVFAVLILVGAFLMLAVVLGCRAWLEGATLVVRGMFSTHRRDLAAVPLRLGKSLGGPSLIARHGVTGQPARLALGPLTAPELAALADAIMAGGRRDPDGWQVAAALRQRAASGPHR